MPFLAQLRDTLAAGKPIHRKGWSVGIHVRLCDLRSPEGNKIGSMLVLYRQLPNNQFSAISYVPPYPDIVADDWQEYPFN